ncbi:hypothetical protein PAHAL_9G308900 [Panicum hallii]|uniref:Uncharacterized protein n=1 Tax=Panicum hallii TaxID=206008 RepID=A0A2T8I377_9POAL|nr:hypothetical protein PAHAL_9G308900 [Panicum hallii]
MAPTGWRWWWTSPTGWSTPESWLCLAEDGGSIPNDSLMKHRVRRGEWGIWRRESAGSSEPLG